MIRRTLAPVLAALVAAGLLAVPAASASPAGDLVTAPAIWVDADGRAGPDGCDGRGKAQRSVQEGVDAAGAGGHVWVCPGTYREAVQIGTPRLTLAAVTPWTATIRDPFIVSDQVRPTGRSKGVIAVVDAPGVVIRGLRVVVPARLNEDDCLTFSQGILILESPGAIVRGNRVIGGSGEASIRCGLTIGISSFGSPGTLVGWNLVRNFRILGILVTQPFPIGEADAPVRVLRNSVHFDHTGVLCPALSPCAASSRDAARIRGLERARPAGGTIGIFLFSEGIVVDGAIGIVRGNVVVSDATRAGLNGGIDAYDALVEIEENVVRNAEIGSYLQGSAGLYRGNVLTGGTGSGLLLDPGYTDPCGAGGLGACTVDPEICAAGFGCGPLNLRVVENEVHGFGGDGIVTYDSGDRFVRNDARRNRGIDCRETVPSPVTIGEPRNTWIGNLGRDADPAGICSLPLR